jgi:hypothetical protein
MSFIKGFEKVAADWAGMAKNFKPAVKQVAHKASDWIGKNPGKTMAGVGAVAGAKYVTSSDKEKEKIKDRVGVAGAAMAGAHMANTFMKR